MTEHEYVAHWRHGWIPLNHAAAMTKAHHSKRGARRLARRYFPTPRKTASHVAAYRTARQEQDRRFESSAGAKWSASDTKSREYQEYYGLGEHEGRGREKRITYKEWIRDLSREKQAEKRAAAAYREAVKLGRRHAAAAGRLSVETENAEYDDAERRHGSDLAELVGQGYADGLAAGYETRTRARTRSSANPLVAS